MIRKGVNGENTARRYLETRGLRALKTNYRTAFGEIDLIMLDRDVIVFVEVKYRSSNRFGNPLEAVDKFKQQRIKKVARIYLNDIKYEPKCRFDVVGILGEHINWVKGAFT